MDERQALRLRLLQEAAEMSSGDEGSLSDEQEPPAPDLPEFEPLSVQLQKLRDFDNRMASDFSL
jgi:hypothetical protein